MSLACCGRFAKAMSPLHEYLFVRADTTMGAVAQCALFIQYRFCSDLAVCLFKLELRKSVLELSWCC